MSEALEAAKEIADGDDDSKPEQPCEHATFRHERGCRGHYWLCSNEDCEQFGCVVPGSHCRSDCEDRQPPATSSGGSTTTTSSRGGDTPTTSLRGAERRSNLAGDGPDAGADENNEIAAGPSAPRNDKQDGSPSSLRTERSNLAVSVPDADRLPTLSMIFTVYDEDPGEVRATLESAAAAYPRHNLELVVVDDGGDPCSDAVNAADTGGAAIEYRRNEDNFGVGRSRNQGVRAASGKVLSFHDAHMRFPLYDEMVDEAEAAGSELDIPEGWSSLMCLARKAATGGTIISSASRDTRKERDFWASGADMFWNRRDGLQPKWRLPEKFETQWVRVPCMMGAGYFMSRQTARTLAQATGGSVDSGQEKGRPRLGPEPGRHMDGHAPPDAAGVWEDTAGKWGFSEQALSVKAYLLGIPIYAARDIFTRHLYRGSNPVEGAGKETWKNTCRCASRLFPKDIFEARFLPHCEKHMGEDAAAEHRVEPAGLADREQCRQVFTDLVGKGAPVSDRHPDHDWLDRLLRVVADMPERPSVLMWRPGEAVLQVKRWRPEADITVIARHGPRANNWWDVCRANGIRIVKARLTGDYVERPLKLLQSSSNKTSLRGAKRRSNLAGSGENAGGGTNNEIAAGPAAPRNDNQDGSPASWRAERSNLAGAADDSGGFDLVLINGPLQDECAKCAKRALADGGKIIRNDRKDRLQLEDEQRRKEEKNIEAALEKRHKKAAGPSGKKRPGSAARSAPATAGASGSWPHKHSFVPVLRDVLRELEPDRILEWGPGLSTELCHEERPDADIVTTESLQKWADRARREHPYAEVRHEEIPDYGPSDYAVWPWKEGTVGWDLAIIDGRRRNECLLTARAVLRDGGLALLHDADRENYMLGTDLFEAVRRENRTAVLKLRRGRE